MAIFMSATLLMSACSEPEPIVVYGVTLSQRSVAFDAEGGQMRVDVVPFPEEEAWTLEGCEAEWLTVSATDGGVDVVAVANTSPEVRSAAFSIVSPESKFDPYKVTVSQEAAEKVVYTTSAEESYTFDSEGGSFSFSMVSESMWSVTSSEGWLAVEIDESVVTLSAERHEGDERRVATLTLEVGEGVQQQTLEIAVEQQTVAENKYLNLVGKWEITSDKWFYSPNGSLNSLSYSPNPTDYYLIFDMVEGEYGKTLIMQNFLYPGTELEVRYDSATGGIVIPFGWTVLSYDVFLYMTLVSDRQFSYAAGEVDAVIANEEGTALTLELPTVSGFNYVGFGLWTYNDSGAKIALGSQYRPTMFPMGPIVLRKQNI